MVQLTTAKSFCLSWGLALELEKLLHSEPLPGIGFFGGLSLGGVDGARVGLLLAAKH
jgi:hypothetical protein